MAVPGLLMVGGGDAIAEIDADIACAAGSHASVLISGEAGSGKELIARLIHQRSLRAAASFVAVDCAGVPDRRLESELSGDARDDVRDAPQAGASLLDRTHGGTVFLEGVSDMSRANQDLLFDLLDRAEQQRTSGSMTRCRLVTATSRDLHDCVAAREFREDLYYRLNVIHVSVPPLRTRATDVALLVDHFLDLHASGHGGARPQVAAAAMDALAAYGWPGNVRELKDVVEQVARTVKGPIVRIGDLPLRLLSSGTPAPLPPGART